MAGQEREVVDDPASDDKGPVLVAGLGPPTSTAGTLVRQRLVERLAVGHRWADPGERYDWFLNGCVEKTWQAPQMSALALSLLPTYQQNPNRNVETVGISDAIFGAKDAQVLEQTKKKMHAMSSYK